MLLNRGLRDRWYIGPQDTLQRCTRGGDFFVASLNRSHYFAAAGPLCYFICVRCTLGRYFIVCRTRFRLGISNFITPQDVSSVGRCAFCMHAQSIVDPQKYLNRNDDDDDIPSRAPNLGYTRCNNCDGILNVFQFDKFINLLILLIMRILCIIKTYKYIMIKTNSV